MSNQKIKELLAKTPLPPLEKEIFLSEILSVDRSFLAAFSEKSLTGQQLLKFDEAVRRRIGGEPLPYILGYKEFFGRKFLVNKDVLIPRPETENLVGAVLKFTKDKHLTVVDIGTGSGCIGITLALEQPNLKVIMLELDSAAFKVAEKNIKLHKLNAKVRLLQSDLLTNFDSQADVIVANLPYIPTKNWEKLPKEIKEFEPRVALDSNNSKTALYNKLFGEAKIKLKEKGKIFYEIDGKVFEKSLD